MPLLGVNGVGAEYNGHAMPRGRNNSGLHCVWLLNPFPPLLETFFIVIVYIFGSLDGRQISLQEKDFLDDQLCFEISSLLGNCAASALFPHE